MIVKTCEEYGYPTNEAAMRLLLSETNFNEDVRRKRLQILSSSLLATYNAIIRNEAPINKVKEIVRSVHLALEIEILGKKRNEQSNH